MKRINSIRGKRSRAAGMRFELKVRKDLEAQGWIVDKWMNNIDLENDKLIPAKRKYNPYRRALSIGTGFPDFLCFKRKAKSCEVIGIEVKKNGLLDKSEKEKIKWLLKNKIFNKILIAKQGQKRGQTEYNNFKEKYEKN